MPKKLSASHLKLHVEEPATHKADSEETVSQLDLSDVLGTFAAATGWIPKPLKSTPHGAEINSNVPLEKRIQLVSADPIDGMLDVQGLSQVTSEEEAWALLEKLDLMVQQLRSLERTIEVQETQLATGLGVSIHPEEAEQLNLRLNESLERAAKQTASDAAGIYLLDDSTSQLKLRVGYGLSVESLQAEARPLRGALADLEALMGNAVLVENVKLAPEWNCPGDYAAALCLPIGSPTMPQGTLWLWSRHVRDFSSSDVEVAKAATDKILVDIERSVLADEVLQTRAVRRQLEKASMLQASRLPNHQPLHQDYEIAGWTFQGAALGGNFHTWTVNRREQICAALGASLASGPAGSLVSSSIQTVVETCWNAKHKPSQVLRKVNDIFWDVEDADWRCSLCYLQVHPESGSTELSIAGDAQAFLVSHRGVNIVPGTGTYLAEQPDTSFADQQLYLDGGELLVVASADVVGGESRGGFTQDALLDALRSMQDESVEEIADHLARLLPMHVPEDGQVESSPGLGDRSLMILRRRF